MLNCEYCDCFKKSGSKNDQSGICEFENIMFVVDEDKSDMEYPCTDITYQEYLNKKKVSVPVSIIKHDDWKTLYKMQHPVPERKRISIPI